MTLPATVGIGQRVRVEAAFIGALICSPHDIPAARQIVRSEHLTVDSHRLIYEAMLCLVTEGRGVTHTALCAKLPDPADGSPIEGVLAVLKDNARDAGSALDYAEAVAEGISSGGSITVPPEEPRHCVIAATPWSWRDPATIPPRRWIYGHHYIRNFVSATVAPGGLGKSSLVLAEGLAIATGRNLLGLIPRERTRVWYWNGEDPAVETELRIAAILQHYGIPRDDLDGWLFLDSGRDMPIKIAAMHRATVATAEHAVDAICTAMIENDIGVLVIDPFVSCHGVPENDNGAIDAVAKTWGRIAGRTNASVELVHHVRKPAQNQSELLIDDARGAGALTNAVRAGRVLNHMTADQAIRAKVDERRDYFRADTGKHNLAPPELAAWFKHVVVALPNGDSVGVVTPWTMPGALDAVTPAHMHRVRTLAAEGQYRKDVQSPDWIGRAVAEVLNLDVEDDRDRIKTILKTWFANGVLTTAFRRDEKTRKEFKFVVPGGWKDDAQP